MGLYQIITWPSCREAERGLFFCSGEQTPLTTLVARKITGDENVPAGMHSFVVRLDKPLEEETWGKPFRLPHGMECEANMRGPEAAGLVVQSRYLGFGQVSCQRQRVI